MLTSIVRKTAAYLKQNCANLKHTDLVVAFTGRLLWVLRASDPICRGAIPWSKRTYGRLVLGKVHTREVVLSRMGMSIAPLKEVRVVAI